jgi:transposase-like protein
MIEIKIKEKGNVKRYNCPECNYEFFMEENVIPYKCANCNYTFVKVEGKIQEERL